MASFERIAASIFSASSRAGTMIETLGHTAGGSSSATTESSDRESRLMSDGATPATQNTKATHPPTRITSDIDMGSILNCRSTDCQLAGVQTVTHSSRELISAVPAASLV